MDIGSQQRVIIVETEQVKRLEQVEAAEPGLDEVEARLVDLAEEEWPLPVEIDPVPLR